MTGYFILMGDVVGSGKLNSQNLHRELRTILSDCNHDLKSEILSPYTTTLGDEFQGIANSLCSIVRSIFRLEYLRMKYQYIFTFRYVAHYGEIETEINREIAYEMMGPGLTRARGLLNEKGRGRKRFLFDIPDHTLGTVLTRLGEVIAGISDRWDRKDYPLILDMLAEQNNEKVAKKYGKDRSQIWRRRNSLLVEEYRDIRGVMIDLTEFVPEGSIE